MCFINDILLIIILTLITISLVLFDEEKRLFIDLSSEEMHFESHTVLLLYPTLRSDIICCRIICEL